MKTFFTTLFLILFTTAPLYSQYEFDNKEEISLFINGEKLISNDSPRLVNSETLDSIIISVMDTAHIPGFTGLIVKHDSIIWSRNFGLADINLNRPVEDTTLFLPVILIQR